MRLLTWLLLFIVAFFIALVLVLTFTQPAFKQMASVRILTVETHAIPVYMYVIGAFVTGLLFGVCAMLSGFVRSKVDAGRKSKRIRDLEQKLVESENALTAVRAAASGDAKFLPPETEE